MTDRPDDAVARLLADPALWEDPPPELEAAVLAAATASRRPAGGAPGHRRRGPRRPGTAVAAVALVAAAFGAGWVARGPGADGRPEPERVEIAMAGTDLAPGLATTIEVEDRAGGTGIWLDAPELDPAPIGSVYEMWLWREGEPVSCGTFRGGGPVVLWAGVDIGDYPGVSVSLEPLDGDPAPSGRTVLRRAV